MSKKPTVREATDDDTDRVREVVIEAYGGERMAGVLDALPASPVPTPRMPGSGERIPA